MKVEREEQRQEDIKEITLELYLPPLSNLNVINNIVILKS
jgi:hypothetical protein